MSNVRLAGGHLYGKQLFTWLSLVVSLMATDVNGVCYFPFFCLMTYFDVITFIS